ncbi:MAG TPA: hypothetical protein PLR06_04165 [Cyclobacteriaceae bacterium]|nr:hypothetical protein [Cyclobacteriaceae bacterium]
MVSKYFSIILLSLLLQSAAAPDEYPHAEITNGLIRASLYLPAKEGGFYQGSRFDWAGVMSELHYQGHSYFGKWYTAAHDPAFHDHISGPAEEFTPVGYDEAKPGETFLKIGVGILVKPDAENYRFARPYKNINAGTWEVKRKDDQVKFIQILNQDEYAYQYSKTVKLIRNKAEMVLSHSLKNLGKKKIITSVYNHNFFVMDQQPIGPDFELYFPFTLSSESATFGPLGRLENNKIIYEKELGEKEHLFFASLSGFSKSNLDYDIKIENHKTGASVRITSDQPLAKLAFWSAAKTVCPEPYIKLEVKPGNTVSWNITYQFYVTNPVK